LQFSAGVRILGSLHGYRGKALRRVDDGVEPVVFDISAGNRSSPFKGRMHYYESEAAWVITDPLPDAFLEALSQGQTLTIRNAKGEPAVVFDLTGTSKAVEAMRRVCR
jgi:hypothetical protein